MTVIKSFISDEAFLIAFGRCPECSKTLTLKAVRVFKLMCPHCRHKFDGREISRVIKANHKTAKRQKTF